MSERIGKTAYPLYWPTGWKRSRFPKRAPFRDSNVYRETQFVRAELERLGAREIVVSSNLQLRQDGIPYANHRMPKDRGVAVWFWLPKPGVGRLTRVHPDRWTEHVLACDRWEKPEHNLRAIGKHVEALRGQQRWGVASVQQAFRGYQALPEDAGRAHWWQELGLDAPARDRGELRAAYVRAAKRAHPDAGGSGEAFARVESAYRRGLEEVGA